MRMDQYVHKIIQFLPEPGNGSGLSVSLICQRLGFSPTRTAERRVQRYMREIEDAYPGNLVIGRSGRAHYYSWSGNLKDRRYQAAHKLPANDAAMLGVLMFAHHQLPMPAFLMQGMKEEQHNALLQIEGACDFNRAWMLRWKRKVRVLPDNSPLLAAPVHEEIMQAVEQAILKDRALAIRYGDDSDCWQTVHPVGLVIKGARKYLTAILDAKEEMRHFCLHRMHGAYVESHGCRTSSTDVDTLIHAGEYRWYASEHPVTLTLRVTDPFYRRVLGETPLSIDQQVEALADGGWRVIAHVQNSLELQLWLLSHARDVTVMEPDDVRESIRATLADAVQGYAA